MVTKAPSRPPRFCRPSPCSLPIRRWLNPSRADPAGQDRRTRGARSFAAVEDMFRAIGGYQAERAADLHDVGQRVIADLMGAPAPGLPQSETPFVLVAEDLSPADTAALDMSKTLAIVTSQGGPTSHTAILARARGIVAVVSAAEAENLTDGTPWSSMRQGRTGRRPDRRGDRRSRSRQVPRGRSQGTARQSGLHQGRPPHSAARQRGQAGRRS